MIFRHITAVCYFKLTKKPERDGSGGSRQFVFIVSAIHWIPTEIIVSNITLIKRILYFRIIIVALYLKDRKKITLNYNNDENPQMPTYMPKDKKQLALGLLHSSLCGCLLPIIMFHREHHRHNILCRRAKDGSGNPPSERLWLQARAIRLRIIREIIQRQEWRFKPTSCLSLRREGSKYQALNNNWCS